MIGVSTPLFIGPRKLSRFYRRNGSTAAEWRQAQAQRTLRKGPMLKREYSTTKKVVIKVDVGKTKIHLKMEAPFSETGQKFDLTENN